MEPSDAHKSFPFDSSDDDGPDYSREEDALKNRERKYKKGRISWPNLKRHPFRPYIKTGEKRTRRILLEKRLLYVVIARMASSRLVKCVVSTVNCSILIAATYIKFKCFFFLVLNRLFKWKSITCIGDWFNLHSSPLRCRLFSHFLSDVTFSIELFISPILYDEPPKKNEHRYSIFIDISIDILIYYRTWWNNDDTFPRIYLKDNCVRAVVLSEWLRAYSSC